MRVIEEEFEVRIGGALAEKPVLSKASEAKLFAEAEALLFRRRELLARRVAEVQRSRKAWASGFLRLRQFQARALELLAIHPDAPAAAAILGTLILAFLTLQRGVPDSKLVRRGQTELPRYNNTPALYDAQWLAERQAYEREVEYAKRETNGGI